jgi:hypothetical protein
MQGQTTKDDLYLADAEGVFQSIKVYYCLELLLEWRFELDSGLLYECEKNNSLVDHPCQELSHIEQGPFGTSCWCGQSWWVCRSSTGLLRSLFHNVLVGFWFEFSFPTSNTIFGTCNGWLANYWQALSQSDGRWRYNSNNPESSTLAAGMFYKCFDTTMTFLAPAPCHIYSMLFLQGDMQLSH